MLIISSWDSSFHKIYFKPKQQRWKFLDFLTTHPYRLKEVQKLFFIWKSRSAFSKIILYTYFQTCWDFTSRLRPHTESGAIKNPKCSGVCRVLWSGFIEWQKSRKFSSKIGCGWVGHNFTFLSTDRELASPFPVIVYYAQHAWYREINFNIIELILN